MRSRDFAPSRSISTTDSGMGRSLSWLWDAGSERDQCGRSPDTGMGTNPMKSPDQDILILIRAIDDARRILREFIEPGPSDAMRR